MVSADLDIRSSEAVGSAFECLLMTAVPPLSWHECGTLLATPGRPPDPLDATFSLAACSARAGIVRQVAAERGERSTQYVPGVPGLGDHYPGPAVVVIEPERRAVRHRLMDGRDDLPIQVAVGEVDPFYAFPGRPGNLPIRCRCHTGTIPPGPGRRVSALEVGW